MAYRDVSELLDEGERKANEQLANEKRFKNIKDGIDDLATNSDLIQVPESRLARDVDPEHDPRRLDRPDFVSGGSSSKYADERKENDARRARKSRERGDDDAANGASDKDSANGSGRHRGDTRSRSPRPGSSGHRVRSPVGRYGKDSYQPGRRGGSRYDDDDHYYRPGGRDAPRRNSRDRGPRGGRRSPRDDLHPRRLSRTRDGDDNADPFFEDRVRDSTLEGKGRSHSPSRDTQRRGGGRGRKTPEPTDDERDRRTVFVQQLAARLRTKQLREFFEQAGPVVEAQIVKDRVSNRSKGVGYVEFKDEESVQKAIALTGQQLLGIPIIAQHTEAEKNRMAKSNEGGATQSNGIPFHRLYVGNIHFSITEDDLKNVFEPFGELEFVQLQKEEAGRSKGYGFVQFIDPAQAKEALEKMNGFELAGRPIRVGLGNDKFTPESTQNLMQRFNPNGNQTQGSSFSGMGGRGAHAGGTGNFDRPTGRDVDKTGGASALDDTDVGGVNFNNFSRDALMRKLARQEEPEQKSAPKAVQQRKQAVPEQAPSRCIVVKNAFNAAEETDPTWKEDLKSDVKGECSNKYGQVNHIELMLDNDEGEIYIKFDKVAGGTKAIQGLNGRWFNRRQITAQYVVDAVYNMNFPKAARV